MQPIENEAVCILTYPVKVMSSLFLLGGVPGLASCQPSREPNDSFDPIRISAKSTLCSLRACTCQLTTRPPSMPTLCANQPWPVSARLTCRHWVNTAACRKHFAESVLTQKALNHTILPFLALCAANHSLWKTLVSLIVAQTLPEAAFSTA